jgi:hypothetical protein
MSLLLFHKKDKATLDLSLMGSLPSGLTFGRASNAWCFDGTGALQQASSNVPRFDYEPFTLTPRGLLLEEQRTNLFLNSQSPATQNVTTTAQAYTVSFYGTGSIALTGTITHTINGSGANVLTQYTATATAGTLTCTVSGSVANAQVEAGPFATSRIVTAGGTVTRATDNLSMSSIPWLNATTGSLSAEYMVEGLASANNPRIAVFSTGAEANRIALYINGSDSNRMGGIVASGGTVTADTEATAPTTAATANTILKQAMRYAANDVAVSNNGSAVQTDNSVTLPTPTQLVFFKKVDDGSQRASGWLRRFRYWNYGLTNAQLQQVTQ